jgi:hypothetical protein
VRRPGMADDALFERLKKVWDGKSQYIVFMGETYDVLTPNGSQAPLFRKISEDVLYGGVSLVKAEPPPIMGKKATSAVAKKPPVKRSRRVTDVPPVE